MEAIFSTFSFLEEGGPGNRFKSLKVQHKTFLGRYLKNFNFFFYFRIIFVSCAIKSSQRARAWYRYVHLDSLYVPSLGFSLDSQGISCGFGKSSMKYSTYSLITPSKKN